ncbi:hypothetical protein Syun_026635 [Stephania yunnanensis]|uniref:DUF7642 domain-containing protein n=1 Tax=Stephania yunnanensis TaxID=152371 RepID=A0AAP0EWL8_9MAGN
MGSRDEGVVEIDYLERGLLEGRSEIENGGETVLYEASFEEMEEKYVKYHTVQWVSYSLLLMLAWGIGLLMLVYIPVRRYVLRKDFQSRKLYLTPDSIVYKVVRPVPFPCLGTLKKEKHVLLPSVADVIIEQGFLQSFFGIYSVRIENVGVRRPQNEDVQIQGIANPRAFRIAVLTRLSELRRGSLSRQVLLHDDPNMRMGSSPTARISPSRSMGRNAGDLILQKLEEVEGSVKRVQRLIEGEMPSSV